MIRVYYANVAFFQNENHFEAYSNLIEEERRNKIQRARDKKVRVRCLAAGVLLHYAVCEALGQRPKEMPALKLGYEQWGKPYLVDYPRLHFNLSHSGDYVCCAISEQPVGVDIQKHTAMKVNVAERFFTQTDNQQLRACSERDRQEVFFRMWCRKESYGKLTGKGLGQSLGKNEIDWERDAVVSCDPEQKQPVAYYKEWSQLPGYSACVCFEQPEQKLFVEKVEIL